MPVVTLARAATLELSAASGLICRRGELWVVADDELELHRYSLAGDWVGRTALRSGRLPEEARARKRAKPDYEALVELPDGSVLALGSCSTKERERGVRLDGERTVEVDLAPLALQLAGAVDGLNIEGAAVTDGGLFLFSRKTGLRGTNAMVELDLRAVARELASSSPRLEAASVRAVHRVELGEIEGVALGFTDATGREGRMVFSAAAERTDDPVEDGFCTGSVLGVIDRSGRVLHQEVVSPRSKIEGIAFGPEGELFAVADADERRSKAPLLRGRFPEPERFR